MKPVTNPPAPATPVKAHTSANQANQGSHPVADPGASPTVKRAINALQEGSPDTRIGKTELQFREAVEGGVDANRVAVPGDANFIGPLKTGFSAEEIAYYRACTPSQAIRDMVNPVGTKIDPVYGYPVTRFEADHIVPFDEIIHMPRLVELPPSQVKEVINLPEIFMGLGKPSNASKGANSWSDWAGHSKLGPIAPEVRTNMLQREAEARAALQRAVDQRLRNNGNN